MNLGRLGAAGACLAVVTAGLFLAAPAGAATLGAGPGAKCYAPTQAQLAAAARKAGPSAVRHDDVNTLTPAQAAEVERLTAQARAKQRSTGTTPPLPTHVYIPVYAHVLRGTHASDRKVTTPQVQYTVNTLSKAYDGSQSSANTPTRYTFFLKAVDFTRNDKWFHATTFNAADRAEKNHLHRGNARSLNLYFVAGGRSGGGTLLGWSAFPWNYRKAPLHDSVSVNVQAIVHGNLQGYNLGDTAVHETGHWLGLFHTFQGDCSEPNDGVADTPEEAYHWTAGESPCPEGSDTCPVNPGEDPIHNFMDYGSDTCMDQFTPDQVTRMDTEWQTWRAIKSS